jgi:effector-binding domain-containing protein
MTNLVPIGRFSRVTRLSVKALRRYDESGLLTPAWVDPSSGYRYYTYAQATDAEVIRVLRSLDMPLDEVGEVVAAGDHDVLAKLLDRHRARLEGNLERATRMLAFLRRLIDQEGRLMPYDITVKEIPAQHVAVLRRHVTAASISDAVGAGYATLGAAIGRSGAGFAGPPFLVMTRLADDESEGEIELGFPTAAPFAGAGEAAGDVVGEEWPATLVAATIHHGPYDEAQPAYRALEAWAQEHGHAVTAPQREVYLTSPEDTADPADYVTEIQLPIAIPS